MYKFKTKSKTIIIFYHCFMKQKGSFTPEIETDIKKRIATPRKRVTCVCKWRNPLKAARPLRGLQEQLDPGAYTMPSVWGHFLPPSRHLSALLSSVLACFSSILSGNGGGPGSSRLLSSNPTERKQDSHSVFLCLATLNQSQQPIRMQCSDWPGLSHMPLSSGGLSLPKSQGIHVKEEWFPKGNPASGTRKGGKNACWECTKLINESLDK